MMETKQGQFLPPSVKPVKKGLRRMNDNWMDDWSSEKTNTKSEDCFYVALSNSCVADTWSDDEDFFGSTQSNVKQETSNTKNSSTLLIFWFYSRR